MEIGWICFRVHKIHYSLQLNTSARHNIWNVRNFGLMSMSRSWVLLIKLAWQQHNLVHSAIHLQLNQHQAAVCTIDPR